MLKSKVDIGTLASNIKDKKLYEDLNTVKVITNEKLNNSNFPKALSFLRRIHNQTKIPTIIMEFIITN